MQFLRQMSVNRLTVCESIQPPSSLTCVTGVAVTGAGAGAAAAVSAGRACPPAAEACLLSGERSDRSPEPTTGSSFSEFTPGSSGLLHTRALLVDGTGRSDSETARPRFTGSPGCAADNRTHTPSTNARSRCFALSRANGAQMLSLISQKSHQLLLDTPPYIGVAQQIRIIKSVL